MRAVVSSKFTSAAPTLLRVVLPQSESFSALRANRATPRAVVRPLSESMFTLANLWYTKHVVSRLIARAK